MDTTRDADEKHQAKCQNKHHILSVSNLPFSAKSKPCGFGSIKVVQSGVKISKREMRNRQKMATHRVTWKWWSKEEKFHKKSITFFKFIPLHSHTLWFSFSTEGIKGTEGRQKHKTSEDKNYSVQYLAWGNLNPPNANCKHPCFVQRFTGSTGNRIYPTHKCQPMK